MRQLLLLLWVLPTLALAASPKAAALAKEADRFYKEGKYKEAAESLAKAYAIDPNPVLLYNQARALDQAGDLKGSLAAYREYVGLDRADPQLVKKSNLAMDRLRLLVAKMETEEQQRAAEKAKLEKEAQEAQARADAEAEAARRQKADYEARQVKDTSAAVKSYNLRKVLGFAVGGLAVASLGTGIVLGVTSNASRTEFNTATTVAEKTRLQGDAQGKALGADICYGVALAAAVAAVIVFPKYPDPSVETRIEVAVAPIPGGFAASLGGTF